MKSLNKTVVIVVTVIVLALAAFSFKKFFLDASSGSEVGIQAAKEIPKSTDPPGTEAPPPPGQDKPDTQGVTLPGGKGRRR